MCNFESKVWDLNNCNDEEKSYEKEMVGTELDDDGSVNDGDVEELLELLSRMNGNSMNENDDYDSDMDADEYHNKEMDYARKGNIKSAANLCLEGLKRFPLNVDLIADTIKYSSEMGDMDIASEYYKLLKNEVPLQRWNWRAFVFSSDYLLKEDPIENENECRLIIANFKKLIPYDERAFISESKLESSIGNSERSMEVLEEAIRTRENASQCALLLADKQLDRGLYQDVIETTNYGIAATAEVQPSVNIPYLYYIRTLAKDHNLHKKLCKNEVVKEDEVSSLSTEYEMLLSEFPELIPHAKTISIRLKMLKFVKTA